MTRLGRISAMIAAPVLAGCVSAPAPTARGPVPPTAEPIVSAGALGAPDGLEVRWWVVREDADAVRSVLAPYLDRPVPADGQTLERLRRAGFRLVEIPLADLGAVRAALPIVGRIDRRWIGQAPDWIDAADGPLRPDSAPVRVGGERLDLPAGRLRLMVRAWSEVGAETLRLDLAVQHIRADRAPRAIALDEPARRRRPADEGLMFRASTAELALNPGALLLLIPAAPEFEWAPEDDEPAADAPDTPADKPPGDPLDPVEWTPQPDVDESAVQGPPAPTAPALGEALLIAQGSGADQPRYRAVVALIPRLTRPRTLLP